MAAAQPFPGLPDLLRWARYHGSPENTWSTLLDVVKIDPRIYQVWDWLGKQVLATDQITALFRREILTDSQADMSLMEVGWSRDDAEKVRELSFVIPNAMLLIQGGLHQRKPQRDLFDFMGKADIHPEYQQLYYDAVLTKPASLDVVAYNLRQENNLNNLDRDLTRLGVHPDYLDMYRTLANRIPPLPDIITMAVREAFSPGIAARFGQYEDFPPEFARYAQMQGLDEEWAKRYWAAHWGLPSVTQGFDMLHRGIIDIGDLYLLLKAQDVMPYWRDKLVKMAYHPLTRVDVRRMYKLGVLNLSQVHEAFLNLGYDPENAQNMTEFVRLAVLGENAGLTSQEIIKAYVDRLVNMSEGIELLQLLGVTDQDARFLMEVEQGKRDWTLKADKIRAIRNLYKRGEYDENKARSELLILDQPNDQIEVLMEQWWYEKKEDGSPTWTKAETFRFYKKEFIDIDRVTQELQAMGYDQEHIDMYIRSLD